MSEEQVGVGVAQDDLWREIERLSESSKKSSMESSHESLRNSGFERELEFKKPLLEADGAMPCRGLFKSLAWWI